ncbi:MAG: HD domain-containing protein [Pseudomonadales bacterium]|nr:HD domain-containing protein [Pseudomonadales bacterium]
MAIARNFQSTDSDSPDVPTPAQGASDGIDMEIMEDFFVDFRETHQHCEHVLIQLEHSPDDQALLNNLFRSVHTIKGNLIYVNMREISPILQGVEDVLDAIRTQRLHYDANLSDVILLALDVTKISVQARIDGTQLPLSAKRVGLICKAIKKIVTVKPNQTNQSIRDAILLLDPKTKLPVIDQRKTATKNIPSAESKLIKVLKQHDMEHDKDFKLFQSIVEPLESRSQYWSGRTARMLDIALTMNESGRSSVDPMQLSAAILMHDIGMAFLPLNVLHKAGKLTSAELRIIHSHPRTGYDLLRRMQRWDDAAEMVLQHHERVDGGGYPKGLTSLEICVGAKIIAIVDTFDARTHERAHVTQMKRPFVRAILEINKCAGTQFSEKWVGVFNNAIREYGNRQT